MSIRVPVRSWLGAVLLVAVGFCGVPATAASLPPPAVADAGELRPVGRGQLRWLGFRIYQASLWAPQGRFDGLPADGPLALSLWYQRAFTREELIGITAGEWERLSLGPPEARSRWASELRRMWSDVAAGDNLTAVVTPGGPTRFYDADRLLGSIDDPAFGPAYLSIWLDPRSAVSGLRTQLLGAD